jgi:hypothetical protein
VGTALQGGHEETATSGPPPLTANMDPVLLDNVVGTLFPRQDNDARLTESSFSCSDDRTIAATTTAATTTTTVSTKWSEELQVTETELFEATRRMPSRDVAPGPDEIPGRAWAETIDIMAPRLRHLFTRCLKEGAYPRM